MTLGVGWERLSPPTSPTNYGNHNVFNDFEGVAGAPITSHLLKKLWKSYVFGGGAVGRPSPPTSPTNYRNHNVFNDFGGRAGAPVPSRSPKETWKP